MPEIEVHTPPRGQQRHRTGNGHEYTPTETLEAQRIIRKAWSDSCFGWVAGHREPVRLDIIVVFERPGGHFGTGRNAGRLRPSAPQYPATRRSFDWDNLGKLVGDALSKYAFPDDAPVVDGRVRKVYARDGEVPGWRIGVFPMEGSE